MVPLIRGISELVKRNKRKGEKMSENISEGDKT